MRRFRAAALVAVLAFVVPVNPAGAAEEPAAVITGTVGTCSYQFVAIEYDSILFESFSDNVSGCTYISTLAGSAGNFDECAGFGCSRVESEHLGTPLPTFSLHTACSGFWPTATCTGLVANNYIY